MIKMLLESAAGGYGFSTGVSEAAIKRYSAEYGAQMIAMETLADQQAIFECAFYDMEVLEFNSYMDGVPVTEGIVDKVKSGIAAIKKRLLALWEKVKAWFHNVRRYLDGIFMDAADFVKKYKAELKALKLDGFEYQLYKYDFGRIDSSAVTAADQDLQDFSDAKQFGETAYNKGATMHTANGGDADSAAIASELEFDDAKKEEIVKTYSDKDSTTVEDLRDEMWSSFRSGATRGDAKDVIKITNLDPYIKFLEDSRDLTGRIGKMQNKVDELFKKALNNITAAEKEINSIRDTKKADAKSWGEKYYKDSGASEEEAKKGIESQAVTYDDKAKVAVKYSKLMYDTTAFSQTCANAMIDECKIAATEAIKDYKAMIMKALSYKAPKK